MMIIDKNVEYLISLDQGEFQELMAFRKVFDNFTSFIQRPVVGHPETHVSRECKDDHEYCKKYEQELRYYLVKMGDMSRNLFDSLARMPSDDTIKRLGRSFHPCKKCGEHVENILVDICNSCHGDIVSKVHEA